MSTFNLPLWTSIGRKLVTGVTGLALVLFLIGHLIGNLTIFAGSDVFNAYAHWLMNLMHGGFIILAEIGLLIFFFGHIIYAVAVQRKKGAAREAEYYNVQDAGGNSRKTKASLNMIVSGVVLGAFVVLHLLHFKYGPYYTTMVHGEEVRDLYRLTIEFFQSPLNVLFYVACMSFLGMHLKHGTWSALQSLGAIRPSWMPCAYFTLSAFGILLAVGFLLLPVIIFLFYDPVTAAAVVEGTH